MPSLTSGTLALLSVALIHAATFPTPYNTESETIPFLKPAEALARIQLPQNFHAEIFASEPQINQPIHLTTDSRGRIWVCENNTYAERAKNFDTNLHDRILILEDTNQDNRADKVTVFWDQATQLTAAFPGFGGVFALCPPKLIFIPDRDANDIPDSAPQTLLDGFDASAVRHNIANGLKLGPDGWLYGRHGILANSKVGPPGAADSNRVTFNAAIWRFHPVTHKFEVVCEGTTNPWGNDWDENGQHFFINTVIGHLWHVIPGAYYKRMYGEHANPYLYELIDQTADHVHWDTTETWSDIRQLGVTGTTSERGGGHAHSGFLIYNGDNWPAQYRNTALTINYHGRRLNNDRLVRNGATYTAKHLPDPIHFGDPWFRGIELITGPDGAVYVADWSDIGECHDDTGIHRTSGRIYKIWHGDLPRWATNSLKTPLFSLTDQKGTRKYFTQNEWIFRHSRQISQERGSSSFEADEKSNALDQLRSLWSLFTSSSFDETKGRAFLRRRSEHVRSWAIQLLVDKSPPSPAVAKDFAELALSERSGIVLTFLASAMGKATAEQKFEIAHGLVSHSEFASDPVFPLMVWYGIQPEIPNNIPAAVSLAEKSQLPKIRRFITRRMFEDLAKNPAAAEQITELLATRTAASFQFDILTGMLEALKGVKSAKAPSNWDRVTTDSSNEFLRQSLGAIFGNATAIESLRSIALIRPEALETLIQIRADNLSPTLSSALDNPKLTTLALRSMATLGDAATPPTILARYEKLSNEAKSEALNTLASRPSFALPLLDSIQRAQIKKQDLTATHLRQLRALNDSAVTEKLNTLWPQLDTSPNAKKQLFEKYKTLLTKTYGVPASAGSISAGRTTFQQLCANCHTLHGEGAKIAPDLTGSDRKNLDYLLDNLINPSAVVPEVYRVTNLDLKDGRTLTGLIVTQTDTTLTLQSTSERITLPKSDIASQQTSELSIMPDGLLETLTNAQITDLFAYLMAEK